MNFLPSAESPISSRHLVLLAPRGADLSQFADVSIDTQSHTQLLSDVQRFRGYTYVSDGALTTAELSPDGRHIQAADSRAWHLVSVEADGGVAACARILLHDESARFSDLMISRHCSLVHSDIWGWALKQAVETEMRAARRRGMRFAELGGWALSDEVRCTAEAIRIILSGYALAELVGGVLGISTATVRHHSSSILRRVGARPLVSNGTEIPRYYEPLYQSDIEILGFDSSEPTPRFREHIAHCACALRTVAVVSPAPVRSEPRTIPAGIGDRNEVRRTWSFSGPTSTLAPVKPSLTFSVDPASAVPAPAPRGNVAAVLEYCRLSAACEWPVQQRRSHRVALTALAASAVIGTLFPGWLWFQPLVNEGEDQRQVNRYVQSSASATQTQVTAGPASDTTSSPRHMTIDVSSLPSIQTAALGWNLPLRHIARTFTPPAAPSKVLGSQPVVNDPPPEIPGANHARIPALLNQVPQPKAPVHPAVKVLRAIASPFRRLGAALAAPTPDGSPAAPLVGQRAAFRQADKQR